MTDQTNRKAPREGADQTNRQASRDGAEEIARDAAQLLGDTLRARTADFVFAVGEALRAGGDSLAKNDHRLAADCFDSAAHRVESFWDEMEQSAERALEEGAPDGAGRSLRRGLGNNPTLAYGAALAAGFLVGAFLRAGFDDPDELP
ncbi:hypothetical protein SAMN06265365_13439 [Tistlia consotensis]|uniref:Uncharacterized protein n=1 Tax=Tistlia consotensis USBA 355 TaxID=560819 RepID=A0A1Y6CNH9_9PROT|nr:hypothetical protein [Tistlia consotensis]SMF79029.1 hypothetical protein SAMN05428998_13939 [Tistlia consotensis USBA 355]SNS15620.1 hypothetical protein SAMN06265365_13439 [Tistlia consotensis]